LDHSDYLPLLVKNGFQEIIYCTEGTKDLCQILLPDSGFLQEEKASTANKYGYFKHHSALPLYTHEDAEKSLAYFHSVNHQSNFSFIDGVEMQFLRAGHIFGAALLQICYQNQTIIFSGDLGRLHDKTPQKILLKDTIDHTI
jgi:metallo-beta-lactamase family protein